MTLCCAFCDLVIVGNGLKDSTTMCGMQRHTGQGLKFPCMQVWVSIAAKLNYDIVQLNKGDEKRT